MSRVDELTLKLIDGALAAAERVELEKLVASDLAAARAHAALLDLAAALRGGSPAPDVSAKTLDRIHERITEKIEVGVLHKIRVRGKGGATRRSPAPRRRGVPWIALLAAAAAAVLIVVTVALLREPARPVENEARVAPPKRVEPSPVPKPEPELPRPEAPAPPPPVPPLPAPKPPPVEERKPAPPAPVPLPAPEKKPEPLPPPPPTPETPRPAVPVETTVVVAILEKAEHANVWVKGEKKPAKVGQDLLQGQGLETEGPAVVRFADGTKLELRSKTLLREFTLKNGKGFDLARGVLTAQVAEQPADRPMLIATPHAELRVLGTAFKVSVDPDADDAMQIDVTEGKVRVKRIADGKSVDVARGSGVTVAKGTAPLAAHPHTGLVGHWALDQKGGTKVLDSSGNLLHGELRGDAAWGAGRLGGGLRFVPMSWVSVQGFKLPEAFTVAFWVQPLKLTTDQDWYVNFGSNEFFLMREGNMDRRQLRLGFENPQEFLTTASAVQLGQWTHFAVTYDGAELRLFSNGSSTTSRKTTRREFKPDAAFGRVGAGGEVAMDDLRVYDRVLAPAEIARVMAGFKR